MSEDIDTLYASFLVALFLCEIQRPLGVLRLPARVPQITWTILMKILCTIY